MGSKGNQLFTPIIFLCIIFRTSVLRNQFKSKVFHFRYCKVVEITTKKKKIKGRQTFRILVYYVSFQTSDGKHWIKSQNKWTELLTFI